jgi:flagellar biosynthesis/type III secretory pathway chaperone
MDEIESLCRVLDEEARVCAVLTSVLRAEQTAVVQLRPEAIVACLEERQSAQDTLASLAQQRRALVRGLADRYGAADAGTSATSLVPLLPIEQQAPVRRAVKGLRRALLEARGLERQNAILVGASAEHVNDLLAALRALVPGTRYDAAARLDAPAPAEQVDRRA